MGAVEADPVAGVTRLALMTSRGLYAASFFLPAVMTTPGHTSPGYEVFVWSLAGPVLYSALLLANGNLVGLVLLLTLCPWLANVAYWFAAHRLCRGRRLGVVAAAVHAVLLGLSPFACYLLSTLVMVHGGGPSRHSPFRVGYWLWLSGMALLVPAGWGCGGDRRGKAMTMTLAQSWDD
jgi:hypothetical protein